MKNIILALLFVFTFAHTVLAQTGYIQVVSPNEVCHGENVRFSIETDLLIELIIGWDFGDPTSGPDNISTFGSASHVFSNSGSFIVSCIVQVNCGGPIDLTSPIVTTCFYIDTIYTTVVITDCATPSEPCFVYVPNTFTADSDGVNEMFAPVSGCEFETYSFTVLNRWGEVVFASTNPYQMWDGTHRGTKCPSGVYLVQLEYTFENQLKKSIYHHVNLLR